MRSGRPIAPTLGSGQRSPSQSSEVSMDPSAYSGFGGGVSRGLAAAAGGLSDGDFKDTVLFMQQQQALHHQQLMETMQQVLLQVANGGGGGAQNNNGSTQQQQQQQMPQELQEDPTGDVAMPPLGAEYAASRYASGSTATSSALVSSLTNNEGNIALRAAQGKISTLEAQVRSLQAQVQQQEGTIRQLTEANINNVRTMSQSSALPASSSRLVAGTLSASARLGTPQKAVAMHRSSIDNLLSNISPAPSNRSAATAANISALSGTSAAVPGESPIAMARPLGGTNDSISSPTVRELLSQHQQRCAQVMLH